MTIGTLILTTLLIISLAFLTWYMCKYGNPYNTSAENVLEVIAIILLTLLLILCVSGLILSIAFTWNIKIY